MKESKKTGSAALKKAAGLSRRDFMVAAAAGAASPLFASGPLWAAGAENVLRVGFVSPRTGALGTFGEGDGYLLETTQKALDKAGLAIGDKTYQVKLIDRDSQSDPARAGQVAKGLISDEKIDFMLVTSTPEVVNPVSDTCEAAGVPCLSTVMPWEAWYFGRGGKPGASPFKWTYHFSFGGAQFASMWITQWNLIPTNKKVGVMYPNDADGNAIRGAMPAHFKEAGFTVIDPGPFEDFTTDYSTQVALFKKEGCEIINALVLPPDFATFWRQAAQQGLAKTVKIIQPAKAGSSPSEIEALGDIGYNVAGGGPWNRAFPYTSPITGMNGDALAEGYQAATGRQATQQLGASMAIFDAGVEALKQTANPADKAALAKSLSNLKAETTVGLIDFNVGPMPHVIATSPILGQQWVKAKEGSKFKLEQVITENSGDPKVPITGKLIPYNG